MSFFNSFKKAKSVASIVCVKNDTKNCYDCKMGYDFEANLFEYDGFKERANFCNSEVESFIKSLGATDTKNMADTERWIFMDNPINPINKINVHSFDGSKEIHITKTK